MSFLQMQRRRTIRADVNPMDKCTVVSIYPRPVHDTKVTLQPGIFDIEPGTYDNPSILVVGPSSWWRELDEEQPLLEIPVSSIQMADSIVKDYCEGLLGYTPEASGPGLYYLQGNVSKDKLKNADYKPFMDKAVVRQKSWYAALVKLADILWSRTNGNPISISDDMRLAAQEIGLKEKPWMKDFTTLSLVNCQFCGALKNPSFPICGSCHQVTDKKAYDLLTAAAGTDIKIPEVKK